ncbi:transposase [Amycolatopsis thermoflava]|uniref:transposase n=1 Tax=Amycolatopsis thermoflava TaxID=84480 RepID=UPI0038101182
MTNVRVGGWNGAGRVAVSVALGAEGILYRSRCDIAWRDVPAVFGPRQTIWTWHRRMAGDGTRDTVLHRLLTHADVPAPDAASAPPPL